MCLGLPGTVGGGARTGVEVSERAVGVLRWCQGIETGGTVSKWG
jgi:hypothetical protein